jgi:hypothetical protein
MFSEDANITFPLILERKAGDKARKNKAEKCLVECGNSYKFAARSFGEVAEWLKAAPC